MGARQLIRTGAVVTAALALAFLGWQMNADRAATDPDPAGGEATYASVAAELQSMLAVYGGLTQQVSQHQQVHFVENNLEEIEHSLGQIAERGEDLGTDGGVDVADLAVFVRARGADARVQAATEHTGRTALLALQAFGREVSFRAARIGGALASMGESGAEPAAVEAEVARPWPPPEQEGVEQPVPG